MKYLLPLLVLCFFAACSSTQSRRALWGEPGAGDPGAYAVGSDGTSYVAKTSAERRNIWKPTEPTVNIPDSTRRSLYSPTKPSGPYTTMVQEKAWRHASKTADEERRVRQEQQAIQQMKGAATSGP